MAHPEDTPQEVLFVRQNEEITRLSLRVAIKILKEELGVPDFEDGDAKARMINGALMISEAILNRAFNLSAMLRQASPADVNAVYDSTERIIDAMTKELKK